MMRLSQRELPCLPRTVRRPGVDRAALHTSIVHLGLGAFAGAHLAAFRQPLLATDPSWGILGVSLRSPAMRNALAQQDFLYTCATRDGSLISLAIMSVLTGILVAPESPAVVVAAMADPAVRIVSISVSERGYLRRAADGTLDEEDPAFAAARAAYGLASPHVALAVAAWLRFPQGRADDGTLLTIEDRKKDALLAAARRAATSRSLCEAIFAFRDVVPPPLADSSTFRDEVTAAFEDLATLGARGALRKKEQREDYHETEYACKYPRPPACYPRNSAV